MPQNSGQAKSHVQDGLDDRLSQVIAETDWNEITKRLLLYAVARQARYGVRNKSRTPDDYVMDAIALTLEGRRHFPAGQGVPLFAFLARVIDSLISHDADPTKITRTIKPAVGSSHVSAEDARAAARLVYRDEKTGRVVIFDGKRSGRTPDRVKKRVEGRNHPRDLAKRAESHHPSSPRANGKKDRR